MCKRSAITTKQLLLCKAHSRADKGWLMSSAKAGASLWGSSSGGKGAAAASGYCMELPVIDRAACDQICAGQHMGTDVGEEREIGRRGAQPKDLIDCYQEKDAKQCWQ